MITNMFSKRKILFFQFVCRAGGPKLFAGLRVPDLVANERARRAAQLPD